MISEVTLARFLGARHQVGEATASCAEWLLYYTVLSRACASHRESLVTGKEGLAATVPRTFRTSEKSETEASWGFRLRQATGDGMNSEDMGFRWRTHS